MGPQHLGDRLAQSFAHLCFIADRLRSDALLQRADDSFGGLYADVGEQQLRLELLLELGIELASGQAQREFQALAVAEFLPQAPEEAPFLFLRLGRHGGHGTDFED